MTFTTLFLDVGGVLLTNGWDREARARAAQRFGFDLEEFEARHNLTFDTYEEGKLSLEEYLQRTLFYRKQGFSSEGFKAFMFEQSLPYPQMLNLVRELKSRWSLKVAVLSNEGRELMRHRIQTLRLTEFVDFFIVSGFVHLRKPDVEIYQLALDVAQVAPADVMYIEDRPMFVEVARGLGIQAIQHTSYGATREALTGASLAKKS